MKQFSSKKNKTISMSNTCQHLTVRKQMINIE